MAQILICYNTRKSKTLSGSRHIEDFDSSRDVVCRLLFCLHTSNFISNLNLKSLLELTISDNVYPLTDLGTYF